MKGFIYAIGVIIVICGIFVIDWLIVCGLVKAIMWCMGMVFTWKIGTAIWLVLLLVKGIFTVNVRKN